MKKHIFTILSLFLTFVIYSQTILENPKTGFSSASGTSIQKIEITDYSTVIYFKIAGNVGTGFSIPKETYIKDVLDDKKIFIKTAEGVLIGQASVIPESGLLNYKLVFDKLESTVKKIDYGEDNGGNLFIYDINLKPAVHSSSILQGLEGNWFNANSGNWEVSFFDSNAVYKSQLWQYDAVTLKKGQGLILLSNGKKKVELFIKKAKSGTYLIGEKPDELTAYNATKPKEKTKFVSGSEPYKLPVFNIDSTRYSGCIKNYTPSMGVKTIAIYIPDIIAGKQNTFVATIAENGFFSVKLPLYYPQLTMVLSSIFNGSVFLEPGKEVFQMIGETNSKNGSLFMGASGKINADLDVLAQVDSVIYYDIQKKILDMNSDDYKTYCENFENKDLKALDSIMQTNDIGSQAYQVKKLEIKYGYSVQKMEYQDYFESAYREKNHIPSEQRELSINRDSLNADYYHFISNEITNNPLAVLSFSYYFYINRLPFLKLVDSPSRLSNSSVEIMDELQKIDYPFTEAEKTMIGQLKEFEQLQNSPEQKAFVEKYDKISTAFYSKHKKVYEILKNEPKVDYLVIEKYLIKNGIAISDDEKQFLAAQKVLDKSDSSIKMNKFNIDWTAEEKIRSETKPISHLLFAKKLNKIRIDNLEKKLGLQQGLATDIMFAQGILGIIVDEMYPVSDIQLKLFQAEITTPFIAEYIAICNEQTKAKLEANKKQSGYVINQLANNEGDELFESIMKKYKGKVVYVDFWATWCGPCRSGMEEIKPLKAEMENDNVVFVYITNQTSPEKTWSNMIPTIKGEHYRVSSDEWNYLSKKFNISGIPHYVLVGKKGEVINLNLGFLDNNSLKIELEKRIKE